MSTRARIYIENGSGDRLANIYHHYDGYPSGLGVKLKTILGDDPIIDMGVSGDMDCPQHFNGAGCLAAYLVARLKLGHSRSLDGTTRSIGNVYLEPIHYEPDGIFIEYVYRIIVTETAINNGTLEPGKLHIVVMGFGNKKADSDSF
jgi:hypothetical protein